MISLNSFKMKKHDPRINTKLHKGAFRFVMFGVVSWIVCCFPRRRAA